MGLMMPLVSTMQWPPGHSPITASPNPSTKILGLDAIRFVCALWVMSSHSGFLPPASQFLDKSVLVEHILMSIYGNLFNGPAAVIVFFVISGFCIHYPFRNATDIPLAAFYARRYLRIGIPMGVAMLLGASLGVKYLILSLDSFVLTPEKILTIAEVDTAILWSLIAELIYYTLYPLLFRLRQRFGWGYLLAVSYLLAIPLILLKADAKDFPSFGDGLNWVVGLPCWLLGCKLAEVIDCDRTLALNRGWIWRWRLGIWAFAVIAKVLHNHHPPEFPWTGYPWTLNLFAIPCYFWLRREIAYARSAPPFPVLEWAGKWSYSLYLMHTAGGLLWVAVTAAFSELAQIGPFTDWALKIIFALCLCYLFHLLVEKPAHWLARRVASTLKR